MIGLASATIRTTETTRNISAGEWMSAVQRAADNGSWGVLRTTGIMIDLTEKKTVRARETTSKSILSVLNALAKSHTATSEKKPITANTIAAKLTKNGRSTPAQERAAYTTPKTMRTIPTHPAHQVTEKPVSLSSWPVMSIISEPV